MMKLKTDKVNILGVTYTLHEDSAITNPHLINNNACIDLFSKEIIYEPITQTITTISNIDGLNKKIIRHELIHAFFHESGLTDYENDEVLVDWIALQFSKLKEAFQKIGVD